MFTRQGAKKFLIIGLIAVIILSYCNPLSFADGDNVNFAVQVNFTPDNETIYSGETGSFKLHAQVANVGTGKNAAVEIALPEMMADYLTQFENGDTLTVSGVDITLDRENRKLSFTLTEGQSVDTQILFKLPDGIIPDGTTITVTEEDIKIDTEITGNLSKKGGTVTVNSAFGWDPVEKKLLTTGQITGNQNHNLNKDLAFTITAKSRNVTGHGHIFTKKVTVTDTMTLPEGLTFDASQATLSVVSGDGVWQIKDGSKVLAEVTKPASTREGFTYTLTGAAVKAEDDSADGSAKNQMLFTYAVEYTGKSLTDYTSEMPDVSFNVTLKKEAVNIADLNDLNASLKIANTADLEAMPVVHAENAVSTAKAEAPLSYPGQDFTIDKRSVVTTDGDGMILTYTITVTNTSLVTLKNLVIEDTIPTQVDLMETPQGASYDAATRKLTWTEATVLPGATVTKTAKVRVKDNVAGGTSIVNTVNAKSDGTGWKSAKVTDTARSRDVDISIEKSHNKGTNGKVIVGDTVQYTVKVRNSGLSPANVTITDKYPAQLTNPRSFQYSTDGTNWQTLSSGYTIDSANHLITFCRNKTLDNDPLTTGVGSDIYYRYTATVSSTDGVSSIVNTAAVDWNGGRKESSTNLGVRVRYPKPTVVKTAEDPVDNNDNWYYIDYGLTVKNEGDRILAEDNLYIQDIMTGGLMPVKDAGDSGTITGQMDGKSITGTYKKIGNSYEITWNISTMDSGTSAWPAVKKITYRGWIYVPGNATGEAAEVTAFNTAKINLKGTWKGTHTIQIPLVPKPEPDKVIYSINGKAPDNARYCEINPGDVVTYRLTIKNEGNRTMWVDALDTLPAPFATSDFQWVLGENLTLSSTQFGPKNMETYVQGSGKLQWSDIRVPAGATYTVDVTLKFPEPRVFNKAFAPLNGTRFVTNNWMVQGPDPEDWSKLKTWNISVTHEINTVLLDVNKDVTPVGIVAGGDEVTFTLKDFGTEHAVADMRMVDDLGSVSNYMDLQKINTGAYEGIDKFNLILSYEAGKADKVIPITNPSVSKTITADEEDLTGVSAVTWDFGDVNSLTVKTNPTLVMKVKTGMSGDAENGVTLYYNEKTAESEAEVTVVSDKILEKTAILGGKEVNNTDNYPRENDDITFHIYYDNTTQKAIPVNSSNYLTDYLATKSLKPGTVKVNYQVKNAKNEVVTGYTLSPAQFTITEADTVSSTAKKINFSLNQELQPGDELHIWYTVTVSSNIENSQGEHNQNIEADWGYKNGSVDQNPANLYMIHNRATSKVDGKDVVADTGFYYAPGTNRLYFSKAVRGFGSFTPAARYLSGAYYFGVDFSALESSTDLSYFGTSRTQTNLTSGSTTYNKYDVVYYTVTVANDLGSNKNLTVKTIQDVLPANTVAEGTRIAQHNPGLLNMPVSTQFGAFYSTDSVKNAILNGNAYATPSTSTPTEWAYNMFGTFNANVQWSNTTAIGCPRNYSIVNAADTAKVTSVPKGMTAKTVNMDIKEYVNNKNYSTTTPTFRVFSNINSRDAGVTLKPGEMFAFTYAVIIDRSKAEPRQWTNTAKLTVNESDFQIRGNLSAAEDQFKTVVKNANAKQNVDEGTKINSTQYQASTSVYGPEHKAGITKTAERRYENIADTATLETVNGSTNSKTDLTNLKFGDVVRWKIDIKNEGTTALSGATLTDLIPYPYEVIKSSNGSSVAVSGGAVVAGTVSTNSSGQSFGKSGQTVTISNVSVAAGATKTYYIYTRYKGSEYRSFNYTNRAELRVNGTFEAGSSGQAIYDTDRTTVIGVADEAVVYPTMTGGSSAYKEVYETEKEDNLAAGNSTDNKITISNISGSVTYRLNLNNISDGAYNNVVLIEKLPHEGDSGVLNAVAKRESEFSMTLAEEPNFVVKVGGQKLDESQYEITYSSDTGDSGYSADAWTNGTGFTGNSAGAKAFRLALKNPIPSKSNLTVEFQAKLPAEAVGKTAWNTFGYTYVGADNRQVYAEPAKVGVTVEETQVDVTKIWLDGTGREYRPGTVGLMLFKKVGDSEEMLLKIEAPDWTKVGNRWTYSFTGLPVMEKGEKITYRVAEVPMPLPYSCTVKEEADGSFTLTNTQQTSISGTKTWLDGKKSHEGPAIKLYKIVNDVRTEASYDESQLTWTEGTVPEGNTNPLLKHVQNYRISGLPAYDEDNNLIVYEVEEVVPEGYRQVSSRDGEFINLIDEKVELPVKKIWKDNGDAAGKRPEKITLQLYADLKACGDPVTVQGEEGSNTWNYTFTDLPKYNDKGEEIKYTVSETCDGPYASEMETETDGTVVFTNTLTDYTGIRIVKQWDDLGDKYGKRPATLSVEILRGEESIQTLTLSEENGWSAEIKGLPVYDEEGAVYEYTVRERAVTDYNGAEPVKVESEDGSGNKVITYTLKNTYEIPDPTSLQIKAKKTMITPEGSDNPVALSSFVFSLQQLKEQEDGQWVADENKAPEVVHANEEGNITFEKIDYDRAGTYKYLVTEVIPEPSDENYDPSITYDDAKVYVTVEVTEEAKEDETAKALKAEASYVVEREEVSEDVEEGGTPEFINYYETPGSASAELEAKKILQGAAGSVPLSDFKFSLQAMKKVDDLWEVDEDKEAAIVNADEYGAVSFGKFIYDKAGEYRYRITEKIPEKGDEDYNPSITYDESEVYAVVTVTKEKNSNQLTASVSYESDGKENWSDENMPEFINFRKYIPRSFIFTKVAAENNGEELTGAVFRLYERTCSEDHDGNLVDTANPGDCWSLVGEKTSDPQVSFEELAPGEYRLVETKAPGGRILPKGQWKVVVPDDFNEEVQITALGENQPLAFIVKEDDGSLLLPNRENIFFPTSGGIGMMLYTAGGTVLMGSGGWLLYTRRRKKRRGQSERM